MAKYCCEFWTSSLETSTNKYACSEGYGPLIRSADGLIYSEQYDFKIGSNLPVIRFCPWCGDKKRVSVTDEKS